jgi:hypothetical protein
VRAAQLAGRAVRRVGGRARAAEQVAQEVLALDELHAEEPLAAFAEQLVQLDEPGMAHVRERAKLLLEAIDARGIDPAQRLERDVRAALAIEGLEDRAHAAFAQAAFDHEAMIRGYGAVRGQGGRTTSHHHPVLP